VKFRGPVRPGDRLHDRATVVEKRLSSKGDRGVVTARHEIVNQNGDVPITIDVVSLIAGSNLRSMIVDSTRSVGLSPIAGSVRHIREPTEWTTMEWVPPKPRLQGGDVALRPFRASDAAAVASACRDPDILRFTFMKDGLTEAEAGEWIETGNERWPKGHLRFAVVDAHDDHLLGQVGLNFNPRHVSAEAHYWVAASERGRGVASRALSLLIDWGLSKGIERVFLVIHPENNPSNRLAARLGFIREGVLRSYEPIKGDRPDLVSWSLLPSDPRPWR